LLGKHFVRFYPLWEVNCDWAKLCVGHFESAFDVVLGRVGRIESDFEVIPKFLRLGVPLETIWRQEQFSNRRILGQHFKSGGQDTFSQPFKELLKTLE
jgi:hypothetical protein